MPTSPSIWLVKDPRYPGPVVSWFWFAGDVPGDRPGVGAYAGVPWDGAEVFGPYMNMELAWTVAGRMGCWVAPLTGDIADAARKGGGA